MILSKTVELLKAAGYNSGFATDGEVLTLWEHEEDPPAPLTRPEASDVVES